MKESIFKTVIKQGITLTENVTDRFKKKCLTVYFMLPASRENIASYIMIPKLLSICCRKYPDISSMNNMLALNYGTRISGASSLVGDNVILSMHLSFIGDEFIPDGENVSEVAINALFDCIFDPFLVNGSFDEHIFSTVNRSVFEGIQSKIDNKSTYALSKLKENMCEDEPFGISDSFILDELKRVTPKTVYDVYKNVLDTARIEIISVGTKFTDKNISKIKQYFSCCNNNSMGEFENVLKPARETVKTTFDEMAVTQGSLALGFRSNINFNSNLFFATKVMSDIFGGGTYSLLFTNVREKMSLCYYCNSGFISSKGVLVVLSGVDFDKIDKSQNAILQQFDMLKKGNFDNEIVENSKRTFENEIKSVYDTPDSIESWQLRRMIDIPACSPEEYIEGIKSVSRQDIIDAANSFRLDTVYSIISEEV